MSFRCLQTSAPQQYMCGDHQKHTLPRSAQLTTSPRRTPRILALPKILSLQFLFRALFSMRSNWPPRCTVIEDLICVVATGGENEKQSQPIYASYCARDRIRSTGVRPEQIGNWTPIISKAGFRSVPISAQTRHLSDRDARKQKEEWQSLSDAASRGGCSRSSCHSRGRRIGR